MGYNIHESPLSPSSSTAKPSPEDRARRFLVRVLVGYALAFAVWQGAELLIPAFPSWAKGLRLAALAGWLGWGVLLIRLLMLRRAARHNVAVSTVLDEELAQEYRRRSFEIGFLAVLVTQGGILLASVFVPITGVVAATVSIVTGVVATSLAFALQQRP
jgi:hypothetical protein